MADLIDRQAAIDYCNALINAENRPYGTYSQERVNQTEVIINHLNTMPSAQPEQRLIPVSERLPENAKHPGAFCPKYQVMTKYGMTEGWYNPDHKCWYALLWFMTETIAEWNISMDRGDYPTVMRVPVTHWMPLPEPFKEEQDE